MEGKDKKNMAKANVLKVNYKKYSNEEKLDILIKEALNEYIHELEDMEKYQLAVTRKEELWQQLVEEVEVVAENNKKRKSRRNIVKTACALVVLSFIISAFMNFGSSAAARETGLFGMVARFFDNTIRVFITKGWDNGIDSYESIEPNFQLDERQRMSLQEAQNIIPFTIKVPQYMPEGFELHEIMYRGVDKYDGLVRMFFAYGDNDDKGFILLQEQFYGERGLVFKSEDGFDKLDINGLEVFFSKMGEDGNSNFVWCIDDVYYTLFGQGEKEDMIKIIASMKE